MKRKKSNKPVVEEVTAVEEVNEVKTKKSLKVWILSIIAAFIGIAIIASGIIIPIALNDEFVKEYENPHAVIELSNGMKLEYEIYEQDCPNGATNFIYLAEIGYFDGTVLFDKQNGFVRFGGWQENDIHRGDANVKFLEKTERAEKYKNNKFGYRLQKDSAKNNLLDMVGALSFSYGKSATEFQITASSEYSMTIENGGTWEASPFAMATTDKTIENITKIYNLTADDGTNFYHPYFVAPLDKDGLIKIKSVKITRKLKSKWKNFDFEAWINEEGVSGRKYSWTQAVKKSGD